MNTWSLKKMCKIKHLINIEKVQNGTLGHYRKRCKMEHLITIEKVKMEHLIGKKAHFEKTNNFQ